MQNLLEQIQQQTPIEWLAVITGILYVILAAKEKSICWIFGIISTAALGYATYFYYNLYVDALLQMFYVVMGFYGIYQWQFSKKTSLESGHNQNDSNSGLPITNLSINQNIMIIGIGLLCSAIVGYLFSYTQAASTYVDATTTVFSIAATFMVIHKKIENWLYWIVIDITYVYLYFSRGAILFGVLMIIYTIIAVFGWINWKRQFNTIKRT